MIHSTDLDRALIAWLEAEALAPAPQDLMAALPAIGAGRRPRPRVVARLHQATVRPTFLDIEPIPAMAVVWLLLLLLAAALAVIGAGRLLERPFRPDQGVVPPPASVTPSGSAAPGAVPPALRYAWIGDPRALPDYGIETRTKLNFDAATFWGSGTNYPPRVAESRVAFEGDAIVLTGVGGDCPATQVGRYRWSLSVGGTVLTMEPGNDPCEMRSTLVPGAWYRTDCKNAEDQCLGVLEAGTYKTQYVDPRVKAGDWIPNFGAVTFTVPAGWANSGDYPSSYVLTPATDYANETADGPSPGAINEIRLVTQPAAALQDGTCQANDDPAVGRTVEALDAWLRAQPGLDVGAAEPITIDGHLGRMLDVRLRASWTGRCPGAAEPSIVLLTEAGFHLDSYTVGLIGREAARIVLVDLGDGDVAGIVIDASLPDRFAGLVDAAMPVVESLRFR